MEQDNNEILKLCTNFAKMETLLTTLVEAVQEIKQRIEKVIDSTAVDIRELRNRCEGLESVGNINKVNIAILQTKAGVFGALGGILGGAMAGAVIAFLFKF